MPALTWWTPETWTCSETRITDTQPVSHGTRPFTVAYRTRFVQDGRTDRYVVITAYATQPDNDPGRYTWQQETTYMACTPEPEQPFATPENRATWSTTSVYRFPDTVTTPDEADETARRVVRDYAKGFARFDWDGESLR